MIVRNAPPMGVLGVVTARILQVTDNGEVTIKFSDPMKVYNHFINLT